MVRLTGPLFSEKAQKQLGKKLIYKRKGNRSLLTKYNKPGGVSPFTPSEMQQFMRQLYYFVVGKWRALSDAAKKEWNASAKKKNLKMSGWNYFYKIMLPACAIEICDYPDESDVVKDVEYGNEEFKGTSDKGLPWTGQLTEYQAGDDGDFKKGHTTDRPIPGTRFVDNGDGTITDKATGLMWVKDPSQCGGAFGTPGNPNDLIWSSAVTGCLGLTYAGHSDWRLPNIKELSSIMDYGEDDPMIDENYFVCVSGFYWSSTTQNSNTANAWYIDFQWGWINPDIKVIRSYFVRPVRLGKP